MSLQTEQVQVDPAPVHMTEGDRIGERFRVIQADTPHPLGQLYRCRDERTNQVLSLQLIAVADKAYYAELRSQVQRAAKLRHRNVLSTFGLGQLNEHYCYVTHEPSPPLSLAGFMSGRQAEGRPVSLRAAFNVLAHLCKALASAHPELVHGALRPDAVWLSQAGRVKLGEIGISRALIDSGCYRQLPLESQRYLAPEVLAGEPATTAADIYGLGALLYGLLSGQGPDDNWLPCSHVHPDADEEVDMLLGRCLSPNPAARFESPSGLLQALLPLVVSAPEEAPGSAGLAGDLEIDVDVAASLAPPARRVRSSYPPGVAALDSRSSYPPGTAPLGSRSSYPPGTAARRSQPAPARMGSSIPPRPAQASSQPPPRRSPAPPVMAAPTPPSAPEPEEELSQALQALTQNDSPCWMAVKDGMDHGPFTNRELVKLIVDGQVLPEHNLFDINGSERKPLREYPQFSKFVEQYQLHKEEADTAAALARSSKDERRVRVAKFTVLGSGMLAVLVLGAGYLFSREEAGEVAKKDDVDLAAAYQNGQVKISGTADLLQPPTPTKRRGGKRSSGRSKSGFGSYEDAMNEAVDLGDAKHAGGERQLTGQQVAAVLNGHLNSMFSCVNEEHRRGGRLGNVRIDVAIRGSGQVMGASVRSGSPAFRACVAGRVQRITFPSFPAPRMGASYSFDAN